MVQRHEKGPAPTGPFPDDTYKKIATYMISSGAAKVKKNRDFCGIFYHNKDIKVRG